MIQLEHTYEAVVPRHGVAGMELARDWEKNARIESQTMNRIMGTYAVELAVDKSVAFKSSAAMSDLAT
jgi:hypothetical protein